MGKNLNKKKIISLIFFIFIILLNIADFLNLLQYDLDFFKKILSWILIGYIFYYVSPTKIFIGKRLKIIDLILILIYSLMTIIKSLFYYVISIKNVNEFFIFKEFILYLKDLNTDLVIPFSFLLGLLLLIIINIYLLYNYKYEKNSLIGSIKLNSYLEFIGFRYFILILIQLFFVLTVFNLFMEWFALGVDAIVLVGGLIYYGIKFINNHTGIDMKYLNLVANSGNNFFKNVIETFKNKNTIFIGVSVILTLHLLVDGGAYLIPYTIGTGSSFYFLGLDQSSHIPLFNFIDISNSQIHLDFLNILELDSSLFLKIFFFILIALYYLSTIFLFYSLLILPFYIIYKNINNENIKFGKLFMILFFSILVSFLLINILNNLNSKDFNNEKFDKNIIPFKTIPIGINNINVDGIYGIDIYTNPILKNVETNHILISFVFFIFILIFLTLFYKKIETVLVKILYLSVLIFFVIYIIIFAHSYIASIYNKQDSSFDIQSYDNKFLIENKELINNKYLTLNYKIYDVSGNTKILLEIINLKDQSLFLRINNHLIHLIENEKIPINLNTSNFEIREKSYFINESYIKEIILDFNYSNNIELHNSSIFNGIYKNCRNIQKKYDTLNVKINGNNYNIKICPVNNNLFLNFNSNNINSKEIEHKNLPMIYPDNINSTFYIQILPNQENKFIIFSNKINYDELEKKLREEIIIEKSSYFYVIDLINKFTFRIILLFVVIFYSFGILYYIYYYLKNNIFTTKQKGYF